MKRVLAYAVTALIVLGAALLIGGRLAVGALVASEEFRSRFNDFIEASVRTVLPTAMTELKATRLTGLATLSLTDLTVADTKSIATSLLIPQVRLTPRLLSLASPGPMLFDGEAAVGDAGHLQFSGSVPREALAKRGLATGAVSVEGAFDHLAAPALLALVFAAKHGPNVQLRKGDATGTFAVARPLGRHEARHRSAQGLLHLSETQWTLPESNEKPIVLPPVDIDLALADSIFRLKSPVTLTERTGRTVVTGSLVLPERADRPARWDLDIVVEGSSGLATSLAKLFRCTTLPSGPRFHVEGPTQAPTCPAI